MGTSLFDRMWEDDHQPPKPSATKSSFDAIWDAHTPETPAKIGKAASAVSGAAQGATLGFADEILGALDAAGAMLPAKVLGVPTGGRGASLDEFGTNYRAARDKVRGVDEAASKQHPGVHTTSSIVASIPSVIETGGASAAARGAGIGAKALRAAAQGAGYGAVQGAGSAKELSDVPGDALTGAGLSAVTAPVIGGVMHGAGALGRALGIPELVSKTSTAISKKLPEGRFSSWFGKMGESTGTRGAANASIGDRIASGGSTPTQVQADITKHTATSGVKPELLADYSPEVAKLTKSVTKEPGAGRAAVTEAIRKRNAGTRGRVVTDVLKNAKQPAGRKELESLISERDASAAKLFPQAYSSGAPVNDPAITELLSRPTFASIWKDAQTLAADEGRKLPTRFIVDPPTGDAAKLDPKVWEKLARDRGLGKHVPVPDVQTIAYIDRALRREISLGFAGKGRLKDPEHAHAMYEAFRAMRDRIAKQSPEYEAALEDFSARSGKIDALKLGQDVLKYVTAGSQRVPRQAMKAGEPAALASARKGIDGLEQAVQNMTPEELDLFRQGARHAIVKAANRTPGNADGATTTVFRSVFKDTPEAERWQRLLFDTPDDFVRFQQALGRERSMAATGATFRGSDTAENLAERQALTQPSGILSMLTRPINSLRVAADASSTRQSQAKFGELGRRLSATGPKAMQDVLEEVQRAQRGQQTIRNSGSALRNALNLWTVDALQ